MLQLSAILNMPADYASVRKTIRHLAAQSARLELELVLVTLPGMRGQIDERELEAFGAWQVVEIAAFLSGAHGWAAGIASARSPLVVLAEDHSFPEPHWAQTLMDGHEGPYAAVAPSVRNGNPETLTSWANFLLCFLEWYSPDASCHLRSGPGHNTSYKVQALRPYAENLAYWLNPERMLHLELEKTGQTILLAAAAATDHVNISRFWPYLLHSFHGGRLFGATRSKHWPAVKKLLYTAAFGLVPPLRLLRIARALNTPAKRRNARFWAALPHLAAGLLAHAMGEAVGYLCGSGDAMRAYMDFEMRRVDFVLPQERALLRVSQ